MPNTITETMTEAASSSTASGRGSQPAERISTAVKAPAPSLGSFFSKYTEQYMIPTYLAPAGLQICITAFPLGLLAGLVLPGAVRFLLFDSYKLIGLGDSADSPATPWYLMPQLHIYLFAWCTFHLLEFTITAAYNPTRLYSDSFLLNNGIGYHIAHLFGLVEFALTASLIKPEWKTPGILTFIGLVLIVSGQMMRSLAMVHAHNNFSHILASKKRPDHELVKTGVYSLTRHPSYVGFFYWALGTQILLANPLGGLGFSIVLWRFFSTRIKAEEKYLIEFFGDEYIQYKKNVGTHLPFIA